MTSINRHYATATGGLKTARAKNGTEPELRIKPRLQPRELSAPAPAPAPAPSRNPSSILGSRTLSSSSSLCVCLVRGLYRCLSLRIRLNLFTGRSRTRLSIIICKPKLGPDPIRETERPEMYYCVYLYGFYISYYGQLARNLKPV